MDGSLFTDDPKLPRILEKLPVNFGGPGELLFCTFRPLLNNMQYTNKQVDKEVCTDTEKER